MKYHVFLASLGIKPHEKLTLEGSLTMTLNEGGYDRIIWSGIDPEAIERLVGSGQWDYNFDGVEGLSDIDVMTWDLGVVLEYLFSENLTFYSDLSFAKWEDDEPIITDGSGEYFLGSLGFMVTF